MTSAAPTEAAEIQDPGQGRIDIVVGDTGATELSGIAHAGGKSFYAVSDNGGRLFPLSIDIDPSTGHVIEAVPGESRVLAGGYDLEGIVWLGDDKVLVCDEVGSVLREHRVSDGARIRVHPLPRIFRRTRPNLGIESLARDEESLWVANEESLPGDGATASGKTGSRVRLQRLDLDGAPTGQWAYETDPHPGTALFGRAFSGVADLLALPGGELLVLERSFSSPGFRARIYQVDFNGSTRTGDLPTLEGDSVVPVGKRLLWETRSFASNFEGLTIGPPLNDGAFSLILVTDDGGSGPPALYALRLLVGEHSPSGVSPGESNRPPGEGQPRD